LGIVKARRRGEREEGGERGGRREEGKEDK
jgi:hypothetical protein